MRIDPRRLGELLRLDATRPQALEKAAPSAADPARAAFEQALRTRRAASSGALRREIARLAQPVIDDPGIFTPTRSLEILQHLIDTLLPQMGAEPEVQALAISLLEDEIAQHRALEQQLAESEPL